jgi:hypothetical protein
MLFTGLRWRENVAQLKSFHEFNECEKKHTCSSAIIIPSPNVYMAFTIRLSRTLRNEIMLLISNVYVRCTPLLFENQHSFNLLHKNN